MNKLAVVTGGTKGIGKEIVKKFAEHGFDIATCARNEADLEIVQVEVENTFHTEVFTKKADLSLKEDILRFAEYVLQMNRPIDVLVNNAGVFTPGSLIDEPMGALEHMIETNLYSAYYVTKALAKKIIAQGEGYIFNLCSVASIQPYPNGGAYSISKFALYGFSKTLREELKPYNIRVTAVIPGATLTPSWEGSNLPAERLMRAEDVAEAIYSAFTLSKNSVVEEIILRPQLGDL